MVDESAYQINIDTPWWNIYFDLSISKIRLIAYNSVLRTAFNYQGSIDIKASL